MDWIVSVSEGERAAGALLPATANAAYAAMRNGGCVLLRGVFPVTVIDGLYREFLAHYGAMDARQMAAQAAKPLPNPFLEVGDKRFEIVPRMRGAFGDLDVFANALLRRFLMPLLGSDMRLSGFTIVVSHPGATLQHPHRDHAHLFTEPGIGKSLPVYAVNVSVPLIDVDMQVGPTGIWPGTHLWPGEELPPTETVTAVPFQRGDCILIDYRTLHTGMPNRSTRVRPILYLVYTRTWFFDEVNHAGRAALDLPMDKFLSLPETVRPLLLRAFSQVMRAKHLSGS
jgi:hypothetical protein